MDNADHPPPDQQRRAQERFDPLLAQDWVEHVRVVDVLDDHRPPLGGDLAREADAHGDACAALHGLLKAACRTGDELVGPFVEQKERCRVAAERIADSDEQLVQELVQLEVRKCGIRDGLDAPELILLPPLPDLQPLTP